MYELDDTEPHATEMLLPDLATTRGDSEEPAVSTFRAESLSRSKFLSDYLTAGDNCVTISFCNHPLDYLYYISLPSFSKTFSID